MGDCGLLVELGEGISPALNHRVQELCLKIKEQAVPGIRELAPGYRSLLVLYNPLQVSAAELKARITAVVGQAGASIATSQKRLTVPVFYGGDYGPDLAWVAEHLRLAPEEVIRQHSAVVYRVYMIGFTPGYPYMGELPAALAVPRRSSPRTRVPKGSVGIAQRQTGIYPVDSPGGWQIIGWTPIELFDPHRWLPSLLEMGDMVKFEPVGVGRGNSWQA